MYVDVLGNTEENYLLPEIGKGRIHRADVLCPEWGIACHFWEKREKFITDRENNTYKSTEL